MATYFQGEDLSTSINIFEVYKSFKYLEEICPDRGESLWKQLFGLIFLMWSVGSLCEMGLSTPFLEPSMCSVASASFLPDYSVEGIYQTLSYLFVRQLRPQI